ncbi:MAG: hypothetical protein ACK4R2_04380 [Roseateles sp.]
MVCGSGELLSVDAAEAKVRAGTQDEVNGLRVSLLTLCARYDDSTKGVNSGKSAVGRSHDYRSACNACDIFAAQEAFRSLSRVATWRPDLAGTTGPPAERPPKESAARQGGRRPGSTVCAGRHHGEEE